MHLASTLMLKATRGSSRPKRKGKGKGKGKIALSHSVVSIHLAFSIAVLLLVKSSERSITVYDFCAAIKSRDLTRIGQ